MADLVKIEVAFARPDMQWLIELHVAEGSSVRDVIGLNDVRRLVDQHDMSELAIGIWGKVVAGNQIVAEGDRIELYRPLPLDPREARRRLAEAGQTMGRKESG